MSISRRFTAFVTSFHSVKPLALFVLTNAVRHRAIQSTATISSTKSVLMTKIHKPVSERGIFELNGHGRCRVSTSTMSKGGNDSNTHARPMTSHSPQKSKAGSGNRAEIPPEEHYAYIQSILERLHRLEETLHIRGYSVLRWGLGLVVAVGLAVYMFREPLKENVADEIADVASRSLGKNIVAP